MTDSKPKGISSPSRRSTSEQHRPGYQPEKAVDISPKISGVRSEAKNGVINVDVSERGIYQNGNALDLPLSQRRHSTPLMPAFMVSAPGKVIVFGEHAVVHGKVRSA